MARANASTLALSDIVEPFCDSPLLSGHSVVAVQQGSRSMLTSVRIAHLSPTGQVEVGPVVVTYEEASDTHLESVYAAGSLWLYAPDTPGGGGRALRISETTGQVLQDTPVSPAMDRPVIGANENGLYLAPNPETGFLGSHHDQVIEPKQHTDSRLPITIKDRLGLSPLHTTKFATGPEVPLWAERLPFLR